MGENTNTFELYHYGVKGMKWGVRRSKEVRGVNAAYRSKREALKKDYTDEMKGSHRSHMRSLPFTKKRKQVLSDMTSINNRYKKRQNELDAQYKKDFKKAAKKANDRITAEKQRKKNPTKDLSDAELRQRINRLQMEKQYSQLTKKETSFGAKFVTEVLTNAAKQTATNYVSKYMTKGIDTLTSIAGAKIAERKGSLWV